MPEFKLKRRVGDFSFTAVYRETYVACDADEDRWYALAAALCTAWGDQGLYLSDLLEKRVGYGKDDVGFTYGSNDPEDPPEGKVHAYFLNETLVLDRDFFEKAAVEFGFAAVELHRLAGRPVPEIVEKRLKAVRARI